VVLCVLLWHSLDTSTIQVQLCIGMCCALLGTLAHHLCVAASRPVYLMIRCCMLLSCALSLEGYLGSPCSNSPSARHVGYQLASVLSALRPQGCNLFLVTLVQWLQVTAPRCKAPASSSRLLPPVLLCVPLNVLLACCRVWAQDFVHPNTRRIVSATDYHKLQQPACMAMSGSAACTIQRVVRCCAMWVCCQHVVYTKGRHLRWQPQIWSAALITAGQTVLACLTSGLYAVPTEATTFPFGPQLLSAFVLKSRRAPVSMAIWAIVIISWHHHLNPCQWEAFCIFDMSVCLRWG